MSKYFIIELNGKPKKGKNGGTPCEMSVIVTQGARVSAVMTALQLKHTREHSLDMLV